MTARVARQQVLPSTLPRMTPCEWQRLAQELGRRLMHAEAAIERLRAERALRSPRGQT
jgi:hypothetical protein